MTAKRTSATPQPSPRAPFSLPTVRALADFRDGLPVRIRASGEVSRVSANYGSSQNPPIALQNDEMYTAAELELLADSREAHVTIQIAVGLNEIVKAAGVDAFNNLALELAGDPLGQDIDCRVVCPNGDGAIVIDVTFLPHDNGEVTDEDADERF